jgi:PAS domain-containing protein
MPGAWACRSATTCAFPSCTARWRRPAAGAQRLHPHHRPGALGTAAARPRGGEPGLRRAPAQGGKHENGRRTWGHSMVVDPWGACWRSASRKAPAWCWPTSTPSAWRRCARSCRRWRTGCCELLRWPFLSRRLRALRLAALVAVGAAGRAGGGLLVTLVYLAARYEASQAQSNVERDAADALSDIRSASRATCRPAGAAAGAFAAERWQAGGRASCCASTASGCASNGAARSWSCGRCRHAVPPPGVRRASAAPSRCRRCSRPAPRRAASAAMPMPQPLRAAGRRHRAGADGAVPAAGGVGPPGRLLVATYSLTELLATSIGPQLGAARSLVHRGRRHAPGDARPGAARHARVHRAAAARPAGQHHGAAHGQLAPLAAGRVPQRADRAGHGDVDRAGDGAVHAGHDTRRRLRVEQDLADALAFRKAMEDSLVTGLRARDLQGRITYVNPAFCQMVGFRRGTAGPRRAGALLAAGARRRIPQAPGGAADPATRRRAKASNRCSCARTARAFRC